MSYYITRRITARVVIGRYANKTYSKRYGSFVTRHKYFSIFKRVSLDNISNTPFAHLLFLSPHVHLKRFCVTRVGRFNCNSPYNRYYVFMSERSSIITTRVVNRLRCGRIKKLLILICTAEVVISDCFDCSLYSNTCTKTRLSR